ncbi:hypothetical protein HPB51_014345 [Rhipicephalus microplus]|uniref:Uncharacterized protein n=1 Tax=Rhipicephalus microplus TaxID=6941 RepID=A0A9J6EPE7_RHIMP|nr:hypothetical protein HPB51_014345 [Rhipicephalus microplus]
MLWQCPVLNASFGSPATEDDWFNYLRSPDRALQDQAAQKAQKVAGELRLPVPTWAEPPGWPPGEWLFFGFLQAENFEAATVAPGQTHRRIAASASWSRLKRRRMDALQETPRSPQEQPLVHTDEESATETTQMDVQTWLPQGSSEEVDNVSAGERHDGAAWTEDGWHTVLTRRQKKNQKKNQKNASEAVECNASSSSPPKQGSQVKRRRRTRSRRPLPPLPKDDIKIILRPHKGLAVKDILGYELSTAVIDACHRHFDGGSFMLRVHPGSNIIIVSTPHEHVAKELREITHLNIRGRVHSFNSYVADPEDVLRGIVHGIPSGTSQAELMANLRVRTQGVKIERARMLGSTKTAIITFTGSTLPRCVYFMGAEAICYPHKPTRQACKPANTVSWTRIVSPSAPLIENPEYQKMVAENKQLALENEKLRCQIKEERREFHKIISSLETKLEARLNALEANNNATHAISRATVAHSLEGGTAKVDIPQRFSEEAHVSQLQMGEQLQSLRNLMRELQSQQQRAASELREQMMQQMHQMFSEYRKEFAAETEQQRRYVNDSVVGIQRAINKRAPPDMTKCGSPCVRTTYHATGYATDHVTDRATDHTTGVPTLKSQVRMSHELTAFSRTAHDDLRGSSVSGSSASGHTLLRLYP